MKAKKAIPLTLAGLVVLGLIFAAVGTVSVVGWEYSQSDAFCTEACHDVHPEEAFAHKASQHGQVACVECHIGRMGFFETLIHKAPHLKHAYFKVVGYERPVVAPSMPPSRKSCESCHTANPHPHNSVRVRRHYAPDESNTETKVTLVVRTVGRSFQGGGNEGVAWHLKNQVRYIATDEQKTSIPWVEVTREDGTKVVFQEQGKALDASEVTEDRMTVMECKDCHNLAGHPIRSPEALVDDAIARGVLNPAFPYVKKRAVDLLNTRFETGEEAQALVLDAWQRYRQDYPDLAKKFPAAWEKGQEFLEERQTEMATLMMRNQFLAKDISWRSFPDHLGHRDSPGCFRCHSGRHESDDGQLVTVKCTACHGIPIVTQRDRIRGQITDLTDMRAPKSHMRPDFPFVHSTLAYEDDAGCDGCHGEIKYGDDDRTFCANSGCHDASFPNFGEAEESAALSLAPGTPGTAQRGPGRPPMYPDEAAGTGG